MTLVLFGIAALVVHGLVGMLVGLSCVFVSILCAEGGMDKAASVLFIAGVVLVFFNVGW